MIDESSPISRSRQCRLLGLSRSSSYYEPIGESPYNLALMQMIDRQYLKTPYYGVQMMCDHLRLQGHRVNPKRIRRLYRRMGLAGMAPGQSTSKRHPAHVIYPYLLRDVEIVSRNQVWSSDITYVPVARGYFYLVAVIDWYSRYVLSWRLSNSADATFCCEALIEALNRYGCPEIFNTDQGAQFTGSAFTGVLKTHGIAISMDGRGRALDNVFIERLWRSYKYEYIYLSVPEDGPALYRGTQEYLQHFNEQRPHSGIGRRTPAAVYLRQQ